MWKLVIEDDEGKRTLVPLTRDQYSVGRKEGNTIRLTERNVSREHARLFKKPPNGSPVPPDRPTFVLEEAGTNAGNRNTLVHLKDQQVSTLDELVQRVMASLRFAQEAAT